MPLNPEEITKIRVLHEKRYNFCYDIVIPALCDSHDSHAARIAELERERSWYKTACYTISHEVEQELGKALGYPAYRDDPKNFPDHDASDDSVCVGDDVPESLASAARKRITDLTEQLAQRDKALAGLTTSPTGAVAGAGNAAPERSGLHTGDAPPPDLAALDQKEPGA